MKTAIYVLATMFGILTCLPVLAGSTYVKPYVRSNGTYVQGHYRTTSDSTRLNNWSTKGNINPYTGKEGTQDPYPSYNSDIRSGSLNIGNTYPRYDSRDLFDDE